MLDEPANAASRIPLNMPYPDTRLRLTGLLKQLGVAALYVLLAKAVFALYSGHGAISVIWPSSGLALAVLLIGGKRYYWSVFLGAFLASATTGASLAASAAIAAGNTLEAFICVWLLTRNRRFDVALQSLRSYLLLILAAGIGCISGALSGVTTWLFAGQLLPEAYLLNLAHWWMVLPPAAAEVCNSALWDAHETGISTGRQYELALPQGKRWFELSVSRKPVCGQEPRFIFLARDITERKLAENALRESEEMLHCAQSLAQVGHYKTNLISGVVEGSSELFRIFGLSKGQFKFSDFMGSVHPDDRALVAATIESAIEHQTGYQHEHRLLLRDGTLKWVKIIGKLAPARSEDQSLLIGTVQDITERKQTENALRDSEGRLRDIMNNSPAAIFIKNTTGQYQFINRMAEKILHMSNEAIRDRTDHDIFPPDLADTLVKADSEVIQSGLAVEREEMIPQEDGSHTFLTAKFPLRDSSGKIYAVCGISTDITERNAAKQQLHDLTAHLLNAREDEKIRIAREIHDDLGATLNALKMDAYWLARRLPAHAETAALAERIETMGQRIDHAINFARHIMDDLRPAILDDLGLLAAIEWQAAEFQERTGIDCRVDCIEDEANLDRLHSITLFRILQEALTNIARHSGASKAIIEFLHNDDEVLLTVSDNGCGSPEDPMTTSRLHRSKSYGMLGMKERIEQLGGKIAFSSAQGRGFCVKVLLPLSAGKRST